MLEIGLLYKGVVECLRIKVMVKILRYRGIGINMGRWIESFELVLCMINVMVMELNFKIGVVKNFVKLYLVRVNVYN